MSSRSLNKVLLIGNLTRDPNLRYTPTGTAVCSFSIATNRTWTPSDGGEKQEKVEYHNIVAWSKLADICGQLLHKGDKVYVEGRLQTRDWKGDDGQDRRTTEIVIDNMMLLSSSRGGGYSTDAISNGRSYSNEDAHAGDDEGQGAPMDDSRTGASNTKRSKKSASQDQNDTHDVVTNVEDVADDIPF